MLIQKTAISHQNRIRENASDRYIELISYVKNSNITSIERYGMNNQRHYGLIDSLVISRLLSDANQVSNGNQLKTIEDHAEKHLTYTGASDFYDGCTYSNEYYYNANGALESDINRNIDLIQYDDLGNTRCIYYFEHDQIEYIYAADGTKLRTIHRPASSTALTDSIDYVGNLILNNGQPSMYLFEGGYASFNANGAVNGWHYYIQDYMGNNRMVVNRTGTVEQITHYYPYGGVIGDISTNESVQAYKFEGKELDRTFGLDNYDIHARQYFAMMPSWDRIDPLAEDNPQFSPYTYCGGDPVNFGVYDGCKPNEYAAALMAALVYGEDNKDYQEALEKEGWFSSTIVDESVLCNEGIFGTGLRSAVYEHRLKNGEVDEYAMAFAGTDKYSVADWANNVVQLAGLSPQYYDAISKAKDVHTLVGGAELTFVGHSLGGGEATAASMATGDASITFNPAAVTDYTLSVNGINGNSAAQIDNYVAIGDYMPSIGIRLGGDVLNNIQSNAANLQLRGRMHAVYTGFMPTHSMKTMVDAIKTQFYH